MTDEKQRPPLAPLITLPTLALLPKKSQALREHRNRHSAEFEKIIRYKTGITRYYNDETATCVGQWILSQFNPEHPQWLLFSPIKENDNSPILKWYGLHVNEGVVQRESISSLKELFSIFAFECANNDRIYIPLNQGEEDTLPEYLISFDVERSKLHPHPLVKLSPLNLANLPKKYQLLAQPLWHNPVLIGIVCLCLTGLGLWLAIINSPTKTTTQPIVDPLATWITQLNNSPHSHDVFEKTSQLLAYTVLLAPPWNAEAITLEGTTLVLKISANDPAPNLETLNVWRQRISKNINNTWDRSASQLTTEISLGDHAISVLGKYPDKLYKQLRLIGVNKLTLIQNPTVGQVESWTLNGTITKGPLATLSNIATLTATKPVFVSSLVIKPHEMEVDMTFNLTLLGITQ